MIKTTVYSDGIISTCYYYDSRGIKTTVDYIGDTEGYNALMMGLRTGDNEVTEVVHRVEHRLTVRDVPVQAQDNPLFSFRFSPLVQGGIV